VKKNVQTVTIETPEHFELEFRLAGIGTRFLAFLVDRLIQFGVILLLVMIVFLLTITMWRINPSVEMVKRLEGPLSLWIVGAGIALYGIIAIGYFILFEYFWSGSTPGKRWQDIRVIRKDGRPISFLDSAVRNIVRFFDILFEVYPIGLVVMFIDFKNRRLGDLAAGTLVILDREVKRPKVGQPHEYVDDSDTEIRLIVSYMTPMDYRVLSRYLSRRQGLDPGHRVDLAREIADRLVEGVGRPVEITENLETWLEKVATVYRRRTRIL
jgi:uncharacterized RDD family membrane protein YckC